MPDPGWWKMKKLCLTHLASPSLTQITTGAKKPCVLLPGGNVLLCRGYRGHSVGKGYLAGRILWIKLYRGGVAGVNVLRFGHCARMKKSDMHHFPIYMVDTICGSLYKYTQALNRSVNPAQQANLHGVKVDRLVRCMDSLYAH